LTFSVPGEVGELYDVGFETRDGSTLAVLDRNGATQQLSQVAFVTSTKNEQEEATELQRKSQVVQLGPTLMDREWEQWPGNTQGNWSSGLGQRIQFGVPIASKQLIQAQLVEMALEISKGQLMNYHFARLKDQDRLTPYQVSMAKKNSVAQALNIARMARSIHGASGISLEFPVIRHMLNLESVYTYEGTDEIHTLILGRGLTGFDAF